MSNRPILARNIDITKVSFVAGPAKAGRNPSIYMKYEGQNLQILVPRMPFPGGAIIREQEMGGTTYTLIGSMKGCDPYAKDRAPEGDDMAKFYNLLLDLEAKVLEAANENSVKWFGKKRSMEAIKDGWKSLIGVSADKVDGEYVPNGKYPPSFKVKIPVYDGRVATEIVDAQRNPVYATPTTLANIFPKGVESNMVVSGSIYVIAGGGFGVTWRLQTAQVFARSRVTAADIFAVEEDLPAEDEDGTVGGADGPPPASGATERPATPPDQPTESVPPAAPQRKRRTAA